MIGTLDYDHNVYSPDTINGGQGIFTLRINPNGLSSSASSVLGSAVTSGDQLMEADGNLDLIALPLPPAAWLMSVALGGLAIFTRRFRRPALEFSPVL